MIMASICQALAMCRHHSKCSTCIKSSPQPSEVGSIYTKEATESLVTAEGSTSRKWQNRDFSQQSDTGSELRTRQLLLNTKVLSQKRDNFMLEKPEYIS